MKISLLIEGIQLINTGFESRYKLGAKEREFVINYYASMTNIPYEEADHQFSDFLARADINLNDWSKNDLIQVIKISRIANFEVSTYRAKNVVLGHGYFDCPNPLDIRDLYRAIKYCQEHVFNNTEVNHYNASWLTNELYRNVTLKVYSNYQLHNQPMSSAEKFFNQSIIAIAQKDGHQYDHYDFEYIKGYIEQYFDNFDDISANAMVRLLELQLADDRRYRARLSFTELLDAVKSEVMFIEDLNQVIDDAHLDEIIHEYCRNVQYDTDINYINHAYESVKNAITKFFSYIDGEMTYQTAIQLIHDRINHTGVFAPKPNMFQKLIRIFK